MTDLRQVVFSQAGHFHDGVAVDTILQHGSCNFTRGFALAFFNTALFTELKALSPALLGALLFKLMCDGHKCVSVLRHTLCQFAYKGFGVGCFACLHYIVYQRYHITKQTDDKRIPITTTLNRALFSLLH